MHSNIASFAAKDIICDHYNSRTGDFRLTKSNVINCFCNFIRHRMTDYDNEIKGKRESEYWSIKRKVNKEIEQVLKNLKCNKVETA